MKKIFFLLFILVAVVQWAVPVSMIYKKEKTIRQGNIFLFKAAPVDPTDPFRGKYITLNLDAREYELKPAEASIRGEYGYALIRKNKEGFAEVASISATEPVNTSDYVKVKFDSYFFAEINFHHTIDFPFQEYYMEESLAPGAEELYRRSARDTVSVTYAVVYLYNGESAIVDVRIDDKSIADLVRNVPE